MKHERNNYDRKRKHKNLDWDEGECRRGKSRKEKEEAKVRKELKRLEKKEEPKPVTSSYKPQSLRPPAKLQVKKPIHRTAEEIRLIKEDISRRFKEGLNGNRSTEEID